jgi:hypothetical protein
MKNIKSIFAIVLAIIIISGLLGGLGISVNRISSLDMKLASANSTIPFLSTINADNQSSLLIATQTIQLLGKVNNQLQSTLDEKSTQMVNNAATQVAMILEISSLKDKAICTNSPSHIDFTSNATVSRDLILYLEDIDGSNLIGSWEIVWSNTKTAIHKIRGRYLWEFVVFFKSDTNPDMNTMNAIFSIQDKCYFDF